LDGGLIFWTNLQRERRGRHGDLLRAESARGDRAGTGLYCSVGDRLQPTGT
jgi:hypothetical protein